MNKASISRISSSARTFSWPGAVPCSQVAGALALDVKEKNRPLGLLALFIAFLLVVNTSFARDSERPGVPSGIKVSNRSATSITVHWERSKDNVAVVEYRVIVRNLNSADKPADQVIVVSENSPEFNSGSVVLNNLVALASYEVDVIARDAAGNSSDDRSVGRRANTVRFVMGDRTDDDMRSYIFGHSLVHHTLGDSPEVQNIPYWLYELSRLGGHEFSVDGQFGFLPDQELPPWYQWSFTNAKSAWNESFAKSDYDNVIITAANFIQKWQRPNGDYLDTSLTARFSRIYQYIRSTVVRLFDEKFRPTLFYAYMTTSVEIESLRILDYVRTEEPGINFYIYENWPGFEGDYPFPATADTFKLYNEYVIGEFHDWWVEMQDVMNEARPGARVMLIPVGSIISKAFIDMPGLATLTMDELYDDSAPHGKASMYFLASLVFYMALYEERPPADYLVPDTIPVQIQKDYAAIVDLIWHELAAFNYPDGSSRVWPR